MAPRTYKVVLLGDSSCGKTSLMSRWASGSFTSTTNPTIGAAFEAHEVEFSGKTFTLHVWDTAGQERYRAVSPVYCRNAQAGMIVYDITRRESFESLNDWINLLHKSVSCGFVIVGNKMDLADNREVTFEEGQAFADAQHAHFFETSALTNGFVAEAFSEAARIAVAIPDSDDTELVLIVDNAEKDDSGNACC
jgi:small GTP-binding protein